MGLSVRSPGCRRDVWFRGRPLCHAPPFEDEETETIVPMGPEKRGVYAKVL